MQQHMDHGNILWLQINDKEHKQTNKQNKKQKNGFYWKDWENKWVFNCDLNEEYVCVWRMEKGRLFQVTGPW